mmetsp:Transcript_16312/g.39110  ORF Transcript_16312/g.39110 Transcript_16312/m.39110 type:complete len:376 (-) Transcript_16312:331-1458(-)
MLCVALRACLRAFFPSFLFSPCTSSELIVTVPSPSEAGSSLARCEMATWVHLCGLSQSRPAASPTRLLSGQWTSLPCSSLRSKGAAREKTSAAAAWCPPRRSMSPSASAAAGVRVWSVAMTRAAVLTRCIAFSRQSCSAAEGAAEVRAEARSRKKRSSARAVPASPFSNADSADARYAPSAARMRTEEMQHRMGEFRRSTAEARTTLTATSLTVSGSERSCTTTVSASPSARSMSISRRTSDSPGMLPGALTSCTLFAAGQGSGVSAPSGRHKTRRSAARSSTLSLRIGTVKEQVESHANSSDPAARRSVSFSPESGPASFEGGAVNEASRDTWARFLNTGKKLTFTFPPGGKSTSCVSTSNQVVAPTPQSVYRS